MERRLTSKAIHHWKEWLPKKHAELQADNQLVTTATAAARNAEKEIRELMEAGARLDEAEEIVLPKHILLPPEEAEADDWEAQELAEREAEYRAKMRPMVETTDLESDEPTK